MKPSILGIAITSFFIFSNYTFTHSIDYSISFDNFEKTSLKGKFSNSEKENEKTNKEAIAKIDDIIKNLNVFKHTDEIEALKAMRDHIKNNLSGDPATVLDKAADKAKDTTDGKAKIKSLKAYIDKIHSSTAKQIFELSINAIGTGRTTGHIAEISITNNSDYHIILNSELVYIPTLSRHQSYVGRIPPSKTIAPGTKAIIPVEGYCANPHVPPVPSGESMIDPSKWLPVELMAPPGFTFCGPPIIPEPMNPPGAPTKTPNPPTTNYEPLPINIFGSDAVCQPILDLREMKMTKKSPAFTAESDDENSEIKVTWPGTLDEIGGYFDPNKDPTTFGQLAVDGLIRIIIKTDSIQKGGNFKTPFSNNMEKEREAIIQQTFWIFVAGLMGDEYEEGDFKINIYNQYEKATGQPVTAIPAEQKEQIDEGASDFWTVYEAVGLEAKVISIDPERDE